MTEKGIKYKIDFRKRPSWIFSLFLGALLITGILILVNLVHGVINESIRFKDFVLVIVIIITAMIFVMDKFLWQVQGVETLIVSENIQIIKHRKLFKSLKSIEFNELEAISFDNDSDTPVWIRLFGFTGGKIKIKYLGRSTRVGQDVSVKYAEIVVEELDSILSNIVNNYA
jgi:hypothetical protein